MRGVHLLNILYLSNQARKDPLPYSEFYNKGVSQQADLAHEYIVWHRLLVSDHGLCPDSHRTFLVVP